MATKKGNHTKAVEPHTIRPKLLEPGTNRLNAKGRKIALRILDRDGFLPEGAPTESDLRTAAIHWLDYFVHLNQKERTLIHYLSKPSTKDTYEHACSRVLAAKRACLDALKEKTTTGREYAAHLEMTIEKFERTGESDEAA